MEQTVNPRVISQGQSEDSPSTLNNRPELRNGCPKRLPWPWGVVPILGTCCLASPWEALANTDRSQVNVHLGFATETHLLSVQPSHRNAYCS